MHTLEPSEAEHRVAQAAAGLPGVVAVSLGGSRATGQADERSDSDLYAWTRAGTSLAPGVRRDALAPLADGGEVRADDAWGPCDHVYVDGHHVEIMYFDLDAICADHARASREGATDEAFFGALMHTVAVSVPIVDDGALAAAQTQLAAYPEAARATLLATLPGVMAEYLGQLRSAQARDDLPMVVHKLAAGQAVLANLLFTANRRYHPGEKRLWRHVAHLPLQPPALVQRWRELVTLPLNDPALPELLGALFDETLTLARDAGTPDRPDSDSTSPA